MQVFCWWVEISSANSYLISLNLESPAQLNFLLTILFWLILSWSRAGWKGPFTAMAAAAAYCSSAALLLHCRCNAMLLWHVQYLVLL